MSKIAILYLVSMCLICSCTCNSIYIDKQEDKVKGDITLNEFYNMISKRKFDNVLSLCSDTLLKSPLGASGFKNLLVSVNERLGSFKECQITKWETKRVTGDHAFTYYAYIVHVTYEFGVSDEKITLIDAKDGKIKIQEYRVSSDDYMNRAKQ